MIITQNEPFYLTKSLKYLLSILPDSVNLVACIVSDVSPFGKKESFFKKAKKTYNIFGFKFFAYYSLKYLKSKFNKKNNLIKFLKSVDIPVITLDNPINNQNSVDKIKKYNPDLLVSILALSLIHI